MPEITLFSSPRACSTGCHIALAESGLEYDVEIVKVRERQHLRDPRFRYCPKSRSREREVTNG